LGASAVRATRFGAAAVLIAAGALGAHALDSTQTPVPTVSAAPAAAPVSATTAALTAASIDAATEHAFAVAGPSVVYVDNVGVGTGSGVIYDSTGDIVTNAHVVAQAQTIRVTLTSDPKC
jgi:putative serine protease PepD